jgi:hypothetical protein
MVILMKTMFQTLQSSMVKALFCSMEIRMTTGLSQCDRAQSAIAVFQTVWKTSLRFRADTGRIRVDHRRSVNPFLYLSLIADRFLGGLNIFIVEIPRDIVIENRIIAFVFNLYSNSIPVLRPTDIRYGATNLHFNETPNIVAHVIAFPVRQQVVQFAMIHNSNSVV